MENPHTLSEARGLYTRLLSSSFNTTPYNFTLWHTVYLIYKPNQNRVSGTISSPVASISWLENPTSTS